MTTKKQTPASTKAMPADAIPADQDGTRLAHVDDPATLTPGDIDDIAKDDGTDTAENSANADAAETLKQAKADAKTADEPARGYFHGQGGAVGL